jgi:hypothetical protein
MFFLVSDRRANRVHVTLPSLEVDIITLEKFYLIVWISYSLCSEASITKPM